MSFNLAHRSARLVTVRHVRLLRLVPRTRSYRRLLSRGQRQSLPALSAFRPLSALLLFASFLLLSPPISAQVQKTEEYRAKANFLAAFPNFIDWPADAFSSGQAPVLICVFGYYSFGTYLAETTRGASIRGHQVEIRWVHKEQDLRACHVLFVSHSEDKRYARIFKAIQGASVLTVGETPDFLASGGAVDFLFTEGRLQFEVNMGATDEARLRISSKMLALAKHILGKAEAAKS